MSYRHKLQEWRQRHQPDYGLQPRDPLEGLAGCYDTQENWAGLIVAQTGICVAHFQGDPGTGKTATAACLATEVNREWLEGHLTRLERPLGFARFCPNTTVPEDWSGFPYADTLNSGTKVMRKLEDVHLALAEESPHVILVDELADVHESIQGAMLGYMDRRHGQSVFLAASNPEDTATNPTPLRPAFVSRMWNGTWSELPTDWAQRASVARSDEGHLVEEFPPLPVPVLPDGWLKSRPTWNAVLAAFVDTFPRTEELDLTMEGYKTPGMYSNACPRNRADQSSPFPCTRTRHLCSYGLSAATACGANRDTLQKVSEGFLGKVASDALWSWYGRMDIQDGQEILENPIGLREPASPMAAHLTMDGVLRAWNRDRHKWWGRMIEVFDRAYHWSPDLCQCFFPLVLNAQPDGETLKRSKAIDTLAQVSFETHAAVQEAKTGGRRVPA